MNHKALKICLAKDLTFLNKSCGEWDKMEKPVVVPISYEGSDEEKVKIIPKNSNYNNYLEDTPETIVKAKLVRAMMNFQVSFN